MPHTCHADGCTEPISPKMFMCRRHWAMVPRGLQLALFAHYRQGQERDKKPNKYWLAAARAAVDAVRTGGLQ